MVAEGYEEWIVQLSPGVARSRAALGMTRGELTVAQKRAPASTARSVPTLALGLFNRHGRDWRRATSMMDPFGVLLFFPGVILVVVVVFVIVCAAFAFTRPAEQCRAAHAGLGLVAWSSAIVAGSMIEPWLLQAWLVLTSLFLLTLAFVPDKLATLGASGGMMVAGIAAMAFVLSMMDVRTPPEFEHIGAMGTMGLVLLVQLVALLVNLVMMPRRGRNDAAG